MVTSTVASNQQHQADMSPSVKTVNQNNSQGGGGIVRLNVG